MPFMLSHEATRSCSVKIDLTTRLRFCVAMSPGASMLNLVDAQRHAVQEWLKTARKELSRSSKENEEYKAVLQQEIRAKRLQTQAEIAQLQRVMEEDVRKMETQIKNRQEVFEAQTKRLVQDIECAENQLKGMGVDKPSRSEPPSQLVCPITRELMGDPVIASDGHTYEREAIKKHFEGKVSPLSPMTGLRLNSQNVIPNISIRSLANEWREEQGTAKVMEDREAFSSASPQPWWFQSTVGRAALRTIPETVTLCEDIGSNSSDISFE